jgi:hypothetical protein
VGLKRVGLRRHTLYSYALLDEEYTIVVRPTVVAVQECPRSPVGGMLSHLPERENKRSNTALILVLTL